jgi:hypothetical protein
MERRKNLTTALKTKKLYSTTYILLKGGEKNKMKLDIRKFIPEQLKNIWFWIYVGVVIISMTTLKTNLTHPYKIISLFLLVFIQIIYNLKVKYDKVIILLNWIVTANLILVSFAYLFASFKDYNVAAILLLLMMAIILITVIFSYGRHLWRIKDALDNKPILKLILIIFFYGLIAGHIILFFSFLFSIAEPFAGNEVIDIVNNITVTGKENLYYYSGTVFYSSTFGDMIPKGLSRGIVLSECFISYIVHIILLGIIINSFRKNSNKNDKSKKSKS